MTPGLSDFQIGYELSPIIFTNGIAADLPNSMLPIIAVTQSINFDDGLLSGNIDLSYEDYFAYFKPSPGSMLINNDIGQYPFANQAVAANAIITKPLPLSMTMICPAKGISGYETKQLTLTALKQAFEQHNNLGGTYTIVTPAYIFSECVLLRWRDVTSGESKQPQIEWQLDFERPLLTKAEAQQTMNSLMNKINGGLPQESDEPGWSGNESVAYPIMGATPGVTASDNLQGSSIRVTNDQSLVA